MASGDIDKFGPPPPPEGFRLYRGADLARAVLRGEVVIIDRSPEPTPEEVAREHQELVKKYGPVINGDTLKPEAP